jgi:hypothetical protein
VIAADVFETIAREAAGESTLWRAALRDPADRDAGPVFSPLCEGRFALAVESIYEGYLLHYGSPRLFTPADGDTAVLLGDYLYAHGLVRLTAHGDVRAVADMAELISLCTQSRTEGRHPAADGVAWAATAAALGESVPELERARAALRLEGDAEALRALASQRVGGEALAAALDAHRRRVDYDGAQR